MALFTITVAAQAKEREGVISLALLRASLSDSITRKVGPIAARQLTPILGKIEDAGHWKRASAMALTCDSEECALKLSTKECVRAANAGGCRRVRTACLLKNAPMTPSGNFAMLGSPCAPPGPDVTAFGCFASPVSPCTLHFQSFFFFRRESISLCSFSFWRRSNYFLSS